MKATVPVLRLLRGWMRPSKARNARRCLERGERVGLFDIREATATDVPALARSHAGEPYGANDDDLPGYSVTLDKIYVLRD